jgi:DNA-binding transcriptional MocR family regulator
MWTPDQLDEQGPLYVAIADALATDVNAGRVQPGERLPTHRDLARQLGVNVVTVTRAYAEAARRGLVEGEVGRGTFVRGRDREERTILPLTPEQPDLVDFHFCLPVGDDSTLDAKALFEDLAADPDSVPLFEGYTAAGLPDHREAGAEWIARAGLTATAERTLVTCGAQQGMAVAFSTLASPGDTLMCEELTYPGIKALANVLHFRLQGLPMDRDGLLPDAFERACKKNGTRVLYTVPTLQNPTGTVLTEERRHEIAAIARRYGITIVEDNTSGLLCEKAPPPIATLAPERTYYLASTSKMISWGLRIGYLLAPDTGSSRAIVERLASHSAAISWNAPPLMAEIAARWIRSGAADRMLASKRKEIAARRVLVDRILKGIPTDSHQSASQVWLQLPPPWRSEDFCAHARRRGVALASSEAFVVGRASAPHAVRIIPATPPTRRDVERGLRTMAAILEGAPEVCRSIV